MRINISDDDFQALTRLAERLDPTDHDAAVLIDLVQEKRRRIIEHNLHTIAKTATDAETKKVAMDMIAESRASRF